MLWSILEIVFIVEPVVLTMESILALLLVLLELTVASKGGAYSLLTKVQTDCELEALSYGTRLADSYNNFDEQTEWDMRIHNDYLTEHLGFAGWIQTGLWKSGGLTAHKNHAPTLQQV